MVLKISLRLLFFFKNKYFFHVSSITFIMFTDAMKLISFSVVMGNLRLKLIRMFHYSENAFEVKVRRKLREKNLQFPHKRSLTPVIRVFL